MKPTCTPRCVNPPTAPRLYATRETPSPDRGLRMAVEVAQTVDATVGRITGDIDVLAAPSFALALAHLTDGGSSSRIIVDMTTVDFVGTSGLSVLSEFAETARRHHITWVLAGSRAVLRPLEATGLAAMIPICSTVSAAFDKVEKITHT
ncbi:anti-anti-sigma factor [Rhodococcus jostii]|uniref:Anti-sigma factor antagonist n=2 Tax=Rhodococcus jostii TaxID=132919 RepID=A0A1H5MLA9_RHOJO|nr:anti-anti-sigma factor [Rhodococcus jostii]